MTEPICAETAAEWAYRTAKRWGIENAIEKLDDGASMESIREAVAETIRRSAERMAAAAAASGHDTTTDAGEIAEWLAWCCDSTSEPSRRTARERTIAALGSRTASSDGKRPLRRWLGATREETQRAGIGWLRGRGSGPCSFETVPVRATWTVIEHGWPKNEDELEERLIPAIVSAAGALGRALGKRPPSVEAGTKAFREDARARCAEPRLQSPDWVLRHGR